MTSVSRGILSALVAACLILAGCGDSSDDSTTEPATTAAEKPASPSSAGKPSAADDRQDAQQNIGRIADAMKDLNHYAADFDEIAPVRAAAGDDAAATLQAQTTIAALGSPYAVLIFDSPAAADRQEAEFKDALREAKQALERVGKGPDLVGDVERAKKAIDQITIAANALTRKLESIAGG